MPGIHETLYFHGNKIEDFLMFPGFLLSLIGTIMGNTCTVFQENSLQMLFHLSDSNQHQHLKEILHHYLNPMKIQYPYPFSISIQ